MRIALGIEYNGKDFSGWQIQPHARSVQGDVELALSCVANHAVNVVCAGRTDTGVHALGQVVHFDTGVERDMHAWVFGANANLKKDVTILWAQPVSDDFHARYSAVARHYRYVIFSRPVRPALLDPHVAWDYRQLNEQYMQQAALHLIGEHDFSSYRATACQSKTPVRVIHRLDVIRQGKFIVIDIEANAFLHHMVRNIAGVLMKIGSGEKPPDWSKEVLEKRNREMGGMTASPHGLYFIGVKYPAEFDIPYQPPLLSQPAVW